MFGVRRFVRRTDTAFVADRAEHLRTFQDHFHYMLVGVVARASRNVVIQNKDVHLRGALFRGQLMEIRLMVIEKAVMSAISLIEGVLLSSSLG